MENPIKLDDLGVALFWETPIDDFLEGNPMVILRLVETTWRISSQDGLGYVVNGPNGQVSSPYIGWLGTPDPYMA